MPVLDEYNFMKKNLQNYIKSRDMTTSRHWNHPCPEAVITYAQKNAHLAAEQHVNHNRWILLSPMLTSVLVYDYLSSTEGWVACNIGLSLVDSSILIRFRTRQVWFSMRPLITPDTAAVALVMFTHHSNTHPSAPIIWWSAASSAHVFIHSFRRWQQFHLLDCGLAGN